MVGHKKYLPSCFPIFKWSMNSKLIILSLILQSLSCCVSGQAHPEELARIKKKLHDAQTDSVRFTAYYELSKAYRFTNIDTAHYYADLSIELSRGMKDLANEARALSEKGFLFQTEEGKGSEFIIRLPKNSSQ